MSDSLGAALPGVAGIILIVAAGGGFKQTLVGAGVGGVIADWATGAHVSALLLGWLVAVLIRHRLHPRRRLIDPYSPAARQSQNMSS